MKKLSSFFFAVFISMIIVYQVTPLGANELLEAKKGDLLWEDEYTEKLVEELNGADSEIIVLQYLIMGRGYVPAVQAILNTIEKKARNGVKVKIYADGSRKGSYGNPINASLEAYFGEAPVDLIVFAEDEIMHSKVVIIDEKVVFAGSQNWTKSGLTENIEAAVYFKDETIAKETKKRLLASLKERRELHRFKPGDKGLNEVTKRDLVTIPLIGPYFAEKIIDYRTEQGNYIHSVEQLKEIEGIGKSRMKILRKYFGDVEKTKEEPTGSF